MYEFERHDILVLDGCSKFAQYPRVDVEDIYSFGNGWHRFRFRLAEHLPGEKNMTKWYGKWQHRVFHYDTIIIMDGIRGRDVIDFIRRHNPEARIIIYYLNTFEAGARNDPRIYSSLGCEIFTFDKTQAERYSLQFKPYFYEYEDECADALAVRNNITPPTDVFFIGADKGRLTYLTELQKKFAAMGLSVDFTVVADKKKNYTGQETVNLIEERLPYSFIARSIVNSKAVLDIVDGGQTGITLRPMEALFFNKKLITNNGDIVNYDFYNEDNVFLLGKDDMDKLPAFLSAQAKPATTEICRKYSLSSWLEGFFV